MARAEARIRSRIWNDSDFRGLSMSAQWAYTFLLSQPDLSHAGVLPLRIRRWAGHAAGITAEVLSDALDELDRAHFIVVDPDTEELLVRTFLRNDEIYRQPNLLRAAHKALDEISSAALRHALAIEVSRCRGLAEGSAVGILEAMAEALPDPSANPSEMAVNTSSPAYIGDEVFGSTGAAASAIVIAGQGADANPSANPSEMPSLNPLGDRGVLRRVGSDAPNPYPLTPDPSSPPAASPPARARKRATPAERGTRIPDNFEPTAEMIAWARREAPTTGTADHAAFVDFWRGKAGSDARKVDWVATWRGWMRREHERRASRASPGAGLVERNGLRVRPETAQRLADRERFAAMDAAREAQQLAIEGTA